MQSDFAAARELLECAQNRLSGNDETSRSVRAMLDVLIEEIAAAEFQKAPLTIIPFPRTRPPR
ncbi:hypothetical protein EB231_23295 [Mesorhizobium sp. NZP2298]|nr:hypothetical protein EB231_23295 [Mesorhizobium sp. NZP2298]